MSVLNDLRRDLVERLDAARDKARQSKVDAALADDEPPAALPMGCPAVRRLKVRADQKIPEGAWDEIIVAFTSSTDLAALAALDVSTMRLALPVFIAEPEFNKLRTAVKRGLRAGFAKWEASDLATLRMLKALGVTDITADWTLYAFNSRALAELAEQGVRRFVASPENNRENLQYLAESGYDVEFLAQQSTPLFVSLTPPAEQPASLAVFRRDGLWVTTRPVPRTFDVPSGASTRIDLSWNPT